MEGHSCVFKLSRHQDFAVGGGVSSGNPQHSTTILPEGIMPNVSFPVDMYPKSFHQHPSTKMTKALHSQQIHEISPWDFMAIAKTRNSMILGIAIGFSMWETQSHKPTIWEWRMALGLPHYKAPPNDKFIYKLHLIIVNKNYI